MNSCYLSNLYQDLSNKHSTALFVVLPRVYKFSFTKLCRGKAMEHLREISLNHPRGWSSIAENELRLTILFN